jgi:hypothetical protein
MNKLIEMEDQEIREFKSDWLFSLILRAMTEEPTPQPMEPFLRSLKMQVVAESFACVGAVAVARLL